MGLQQLLHFLQALVKDGLVQLRVGRYLRDAIKGGGGYNREGHNYSCLYHHNPTKGRLAIYTSFVEAFWPLTWRAWCRKSFVRAPLCLSHNRLRLVMLLKINRLAKSCRKLLGSCTPASSKRHCSHSASSCSKPRARQAALKVGCTTVVGVWGRWVVLRLAQQATTVQGCCCCEPKWLQSRIQIWPFG